MAFGGKPSAPAATAKQMAYLESLLEKAGFASFREARHRFGLTQRQAGGKFTMPEASTLIDRLVNGDETDATIDPASAKAAAIDEEYFAAQALVVRGMPAQVLADELLRRGWTVAEPT
ncbi:MAG: hypothetical protein WCI22_05605 [Actinomycetota bacterium]